MNAWKAILATVVIFTAGVLTGGMLIRHSERLPSPGLRHIGAAFRPPAPASAGGLRVEFLRRAQRELGLTPQQKERVDRLIRDSQERTREIMKPVAQDLRDEVEGTMEEFRDVLTTEQNLRFDQLLKQQQQQHQREQHRFMPRERPSEGMPPT